MRKLESQKKRLETATDSLTRYGSVGIMALRGASKPERLEEDFHVALGGRLLLLPARGNIQGPQDDELAQDTLQSIQLHEHIYGSRGILGFKDVDFSGRAGHGSKLITDYVGALMVTAIKDRALTGHSLISEPTSMSILALGQGEAVDLRSSYRYDRVRDRGIVADVSIVYALDAKDNYYTNLDEGLIAGPGTRLN
jgi:hypothetical protein